jgi:broad specificity phosphatase PhoE
MKLYITRHGQTYDNVREVFSGQEPGRLTQNGIKHAQHLGQLVKKVKPDDIFSSDLQRAFQTAMIAAGVAGYKGPVDLHDKTLREVHFGDFQGKTIKEIRKLCIGAGLSGLADLAEYDARYMNDGALRDPLESKLFLEPLADIQKRRDAWRAYLQDEAENHPGKNILLVSHSAFIAYLMERFIYGPKIGHHITTRDQGGFFPQHPHEVSVLTLNTGGNVVQALINEPIEKLLK